jgi:hypothetical protein
MSTYTPLFFAPFDFAADIFMKAEGTNFYIGADVNPVPLTATVDIDLSAFTGTFQARDTGAFFGFAEGSDIVFWDQTTGRVGLWDVDPVTGAYTPLALTATVGGPQAVVNPASGWQLLETNGFDPDSDGDADLLWWNPTGGQVGWWDLNVDPANPGVYTPHALASGVFGSTWSYQGVGDFDGDYPAVFSVGLKGDDILWTSTTGAIGYWDMAGGAGPANVTYTAESFELSGGPNTPLTVPAGSTVAAVFDFNGDGWDDILFRDGPAAVAGQTRLLVWQNDASVDPVTNNAEIINVGEIGTIPNAVQIWNASIYAGFVGPDDLLLENEATGQIRVYANPGVATPGVDLFAASAGNQLLQLPQYDWYSEGNFGSLVG